MDPSDEELAQSIAELDMPRIIHNPKLRHDVNFDRELYFRPNVDGAKGRQKLRLAEDYWKALGGALYAFSDIHDAGFVEADFRFASSDNKITDDRRLRGLIDAIHADGKGYTGAADSKESNERQRRGRGQRKNNAYWKDFNSREIEASLDLCITPVPS